MRARTGGAPSRAPQKTSAGATKQTCSRTWIHSFRAAASYSCGHVPERDHRRLHGERDPRALQEAGGAAERGRARQRAADVAPRRQRKRQPHARPRAAEHDERRHDGHEDDVLGHVHREPCVRPVVEGRARARRTRARRRCRSSPRARAAAFRAARGRRGSPPRRRRREAADPSRAGRGRSRSRWRSPGGTSSRS